MLLHDNNIAGRRTGWRRSPVGFARFALIGLSLAGTACQLPPVRPTGDVFAVVLGVAQDGGHPHLGCANECCAAARADPSLGHRVACLALVDRLAGQRFLIDSTPDLPEQIALLESVTGDRRVSRTNPVEGILLTHAHVGHYAGLMYLGREVMAARQVSCFGTRRMLDFLSGNGPWNLLIEEKHITPLLVEPNVEFTLSPRIHVTALPVPHRDEYSDTVAYVVRGPAGSLLWLPDIDRWDGWDRKLEDVVRDVDVAFLDGTFYDDGEIAGRDASQVPHPRVVETMRRLEAAGLNDGRVHFVHLNHTNPLLTSAAARRAIERRGFRVATEGCVFALSAAE